MVATIYWCFLASSAFTNLYFPATIRRNIVRTLFAQNIFFFFESFGFYSTFWILRFSLVGFVLLSCCSGPFSVQSNENAKICTTIATVIINKEKWLHECTNRSKFVFVYVRKIFVRGHCSLSHTLKFTFSWMVEARWAAGWRRWKERTGKKERKIPSHPSLWRECTSCNQILVWMG